VYKSIRIPSGGVKGIQTSVFFEKSLAFAGSKDVERNAVIKREIAALFVAKDETENTS
jgi:hypothetical protein